MLCREWCNAISNLVHQALAPSPWKGNPRNQSGTAGGTETRHSIAARELFDICLLRPLYTCRLGFVVGPPKTLVDAGLLSAQTVSA